MTDKKIQEMRKRSEKDSISMKGCAWAFKDRAYLLAENEAKDTIIAEGRRLMEMVEWIDAEECYYCFEPRENGHKEGCPLNAWLKKVQDE